MQKTTFTLAALVFAAIFIAGCHKKDSDTNTTEDTGYASDQALSEKMFDDAQSIADQGSVTTGSGAFKTSGCATVTHSGTSFTIDFGPTNCLCRDGRNRRGKIITNYTGAYADSASTHTITFDSYYQNDNKIEGTKTVTNMGHNAAGHPFFNVTVRGVITKTDGTSITTTSNRIRTWTAGYATPSTWSDDVYEVTGSGTIVRPAGTVTVEIMPATPLIISLDCRWIEAGSIRYTLSGGRTRTLNYGDTPACDNMAKLTLATGTERDITLP